MKEGENVKKKLTAVVSLLGVTVLVLLAGCAFVNSPPTASFTRTPSSGEAPLNVSFDASASSDPDGSIVSYDWHFGDGGSGSGITTTHTYTSPGTYTAQLTVTDDNGATDSAAHSVVVSVGSKLQILDWQLLPYDNMFMPWVVRGHAKNVSGRTLNYAEVDAQFYDSNNVLLSSWFDNITDLPAGVTWEFNIYCINSEVADRVDHATVSVGNCR